MNAEKLTEKITVCPSLLLALLLVPNLCLAGSPTRAEGNHKGKSKLSTKTITSETLQNSVREQLLGLLGVGWPKHQNIQTSTVSIFYSQDKMSLPKKDFSLFSYYLWDTRHRKLSSCKGVGSFVNVAQH